MGNFGFNFSGSVVGLEGRSECNFCGFKMMVIEKFVLFVYLVLVGRWYGLLGEEWIVI